MWLREPLLHFLMLGALVFAGYILIDQKDQRHNEIFVTRGQQDHLVSIFRKTWLRSPTEEEFTGIVEEWIRSEIAYRQAQKMGLDENDMIVRRRLRQKLELLAEEVVMIPHPTSTILKKYFAERHADYTQEPLYSLRQIYFSTDRRGESASAAAEQLLQRLQEAPFPNNLKSMGDQLPLPYRFENVLESDLTNRFGEIFVQNLQRRALKQWHGPLQSTYGLHLVWIKEYTPGRPMTFEEAEHKLRRDWANEQQEEAIEKLYKRLRTQYSIKIEPATDDEGNES